MEIDLVDERVHRDSLVMEYALCDKIEQAVADALLFHVPGTLRIEWGSPPEITACQQTKGQAAPTAELPGVAVTVQAVDPGQRIPAAWDERFERGDDHA